MSIDNQGKFTEAEHTKKRLDKYRKAGDAERLEELYDGKDIEIMQIFNSYRKQLEYYDDILKLTDDNEARKDIMKEQDEVRKEMIQEISEILSLLSTKNS